MTIPLIDPWGNAPSRGDVANFADDADAWNAQMQPQTDAMNAQATAMNDTAVQVDADATSASASQQAAADSAAISQANANFAGEWDTLAGIGDPLNIPASVFHDGVYWILLVDLADVSTSEPSTANSDWDDIARPPILNRLSGGGAIDTLRVNLVTDAGAYDLPPADSLDADSYIVIERPSRYQDNEPTFTRDGTDTIEGPDGTDTVITFTAGGLQSLRVTTDGVSVWTV